MINLRGVDLNLLTVFEAVYNNQSLTRAGSQIGMTQPAMSNALSRLRTTFKDDLFVRSEQRMIPTPRARELQPQISEALGILRKALEESQEFDLTRPTTFNIVGIEYLEVFVIPKILANNPQISPHIDFTLHTMWLENIETRLATNELDLMLDFQAPGDEALESIELGRFPFVPLAHKGHPLESCTLEVEDLVNHNFVTLPPARGSKPMFTEQLLREKGLELNIAARVTSHIGLGFYLLETNCVGLVPKNLASLLCEKFDLVEIDNTLPEMSVANILIWHTSVTHDPANRWLREQIIGLYKSP